MMRYFLSIFFIYSVAFAEPLLTSWYMDASRQYARIYGYQTDIDDKTPRYTWTHPESGTGQEEITYAGVHEVSYNANFVYVRSSGLGSHIMGPWWRDNQTKGDIFGNWPGSYAYIMSFPRIADPANPSIPALRTSTGGGAIGMFVDGVAMFDTRDTLSWNPFVQADGNVGGTVVGTGYWERDAYVNEGLTFDTSFAHQAGESYHYHANPPALRYQLGDSVTYDEETDEYSEVVGGNGQHSPILGWVRDGLPIYGPYAYSDPLDPNSPVTKMRSGFQKRIDLAGTGAPRDSYPAWAVRYRGTLPSDQHGPDVAPQYPTGHYIQDYEYLGDVGGILGVDFDLDEYNTRYCVTPEFPNGVRAYFVSIEDDGEPKFPYNIGRQYYADPTGGNYNNSDARNNNNFVDPGDRIIYAEGGPESPINDIAIETDSANEDIIITWVGVEGGRYEITTSNDFTSQVEMQDETIVNLTNGKPLGTITDAEALPQSDKKFYQVSAESVAPFDDTGFDLDKVSEEEAGDQISITLDGIAPADLSIAPNVILLNGEAVEFVARPSQNEITFLYDASLLTGGEVLSATFPGSSIPVTGTYAQHISDEATNILFILIDDWGVDNSPIDNVAGAYNGIAGAGGQDLPEMPTLDSLASSSIRFEHAYVQPTCAPTRMSIMSGRSSYSTGVGAPGGAASNRDAASIMTIAEAIDFANPNYTSCLIGKWHLGTGTGPDDQGPKADGWDVFWGAPQGNIQNYYNWQRTDLDEIPTNEAGIFVNNNGESETTDGSILDTTGDAARETGYATTVNTNDAIDFINSQGADPWLCWVAYNAPHSQSDTPLFPSPPTNVDGNVEMNGVEYTGNLTSNRDRYKATLWALDNEINRLLSHVDLNETTVILVGDNGSQGSQVQDTNLFPSNHAKGTIYNGGVHVPFIIRPAGGLSKSRVISEPVQGMDLFPTMCELMGIDPDTLGQDLDGESLIPLMNGISNPDKIVLAETFDTGTGGRTLRKGQYKLNIHDDPYDNTNVPVLEFFDLSISLQEDASEDLLRDSYTMTSEEQSIYDELIAENERLNTPALNFMTGAPLLPNLITTSVDLTGVTGLQNGTVIGSVPRLTNSSGEDVVIQAVRIGNASVGYLDATNISRTSDGTTADRFWATFDFDVGTSGLPAGNYDIVVQYPGGAGPRIFTVTDGYNHP